MKYIDEIVDSSNDEILFADKLLMIKEKMESEDSYKEVKLFIKNLNKFCEQNIEKSRAVNSDYILLNTNNFCMFILQRLIQRIHTDCVVHEEMVKKLLHVEGLDKDTKKRLKEQYVDNVFSCLTDGFTEETGYSFELVDDGEKVLYDFCNALFGGLDLKVLNEIVGNDLMVLIGKNGKQSARLQGLNMYLISLKDFLEYTNEGKLDAGKMCATVVNGLTEIAVIKLLNELLTSSDKQLLCDKYNLKESDLNMSIGIEIAKSITKDKTGEMLDIVVSMAKERNTIEEKINRKELEIASNINKIML